MYRNNSRGFTLVEIMIVVAIIGIVIAIAVPSYLRARENSRGTACQENLQKIDSAKEQYALENKIPAGDFIPDTFLVGTEKYIKSTPQCPSGGEYWYGGVGHVPVCSYSLLAMGPGNKYAGKHTINGKFSYSDLGLPEDVPVVTE